MEQHSRAWKSLKRQKRLRQIITLVLIISLAVIIPCSCVQTYGMSHTGIDGSQFGKNIKCSFQFTRVEQLYIEKYANFTEEQMEIFRMRCAGKTNLQISFHMESKYGSENPTHQYSLRKVERQVRKIKNKIIRII